MSRRSLALLVALSATAAPALGSFPGRNGSIFWTEQEGSGSSPASAELHGLDLVTGNDRRVWECSTSPPVEPTTWCTGVTSAATSPDGHVALVSSREQYTFPGPARTRTLRLFDRFGARRDVELSPAVSYRNDGWSRRLHFLNDGVTLVAELYSDDSASQYVHRLLSTDGVLGEQVGPTDAQSFDWSIDGRAVFVQRGNLVLLAPDGAQRKLTWRGASDPSWSPRGRRIVFVRDHDLYVIDSRGGRARRLTRRGGDWPAWSPDGRKIAFVRWKPHRTDAFGYDGVPYLYVLDLRSGRARQVLGRDLPMDRSYASPPEWQALPRLR